MVFNYGVYQFNKNSLLPNSRSVPSTLNIDEMGYVLYYTSQCPFNAKYVPIVEEIAKEKGVQFKSIHLQSKEQSTECTYADYNLRSVL